MWPQGQAELPRLWRVLCRSWRGVLACGSAVPLAGLAVWRRCATEG